MLLHVTKVKIQELLLFNPVLTIMMFFNKHHVELVLIIVLIVFLPKLK